MYIFEFTDEEIKIFNKKKNILIKEKIPSNIIVNNKLYDYLKLYNILLNIINKYKLNNHLFKINIKVLIFEEISPSEIYLYKLLFKELSNYKVSIIYIKDYFPSNTIFISGKELYYHNKKLDKLKKDKYILVGNSDNFKDLKPSLENKYNITLLEYEKCNTIIYEKV